MIPTYNRPDFARNAVLQWIAQTRKPDLLCIHQNGNQESYEWVVEDLKHLINIKWVHVPRDLPQHFWYAVPLSLLIQDGCDVFLWADHDDIYYTNHVEKSLENLEGYDITLSEICAILFVKDKQYKYQKPDKFKIHAPGGMSSSMVFNKCNSWLHDP
jgi:GT2 family glycosyltransferase